MDYIVTSAAIMLGFLVIEFSLVDRLIVTSSIFRKGKMDTLYLNEHVRKHSRILYRSVPVVLGLIFSNSLLAFGESAFTATLASFPFLAFYAALSFITYRKQLEKLQRGLPNASDEE